MFLSRHPYLFFFSVCVAGISVLVVSLATLIFAFSPRSLRIEDANIGVVEITGVINNSDRVIDSIRQLREAVNIQGIVIRIDSPGGGVGPSQEIYREIIKTLPVKKVVVSMGSVAASGGYYIAAASSHVIANPGTITGSIGVIMKFTNVENLLGKIGLIPMTVKSALYKDIGSSTRKINEEEQVILQDLADDIHSQFVSDISIGRSMDVVAVEKVADGRLFTGKRALKLGLVDRLGNFNDAIQWVGELGCVKGEIKPVYMCEKEDTIFKLLTSLSSQEFFKRLIYHENYSGLLCRADLFNV